MKFWLGVVGILLILLSHGEANAHPVKHSASSYVGFNPFGLTPTIKDVKHVKVHRVKVRHLHFSRSHHAGGSERRDEHHVSNDARPGAWCGWYMRQLFGGGPEYNLAANWAKRGEPTVPGVGAVVVWPHHVGKITGYDDKRKEWIVLSGNSGHSRTVTEHPRSIHGAIAFRKI